MQIGLPSFFLYNWILWIEFIYEIWIISAFCRVYNLSFVWREIIDVLYGVFFSVRVRRRESNELYVIWIPFFFLFCNENIFLNSRIGFWNSCFISLRTLSAVWFMLNGKKILDFIELNCTKAKCMLSFSSLILLNCRFSILLCYRNIIYPSPIQKKCQFGIMIFNCVVVSCGFLSNSIAYFIDWLLGLF